MVVFVVAKQQAACPTREFIIFTSRQSFVQTSSLKMGEKELKEFTADEVSKHTTQDDCWLVIGNQSNGESPNATVSPQY